MHVGVLWGSSVPDLLPAPVLWNEQSCPCPPTQNKTQAAAVPCPFLQDAGSPLLGQASVLVQLHQHVSTPPSPVEGCCGHSVHTASTWSHRNWTVRVQSQFYLSQTHTTGRYPLPLPTRGALCITPAFPPLPASFPLDTWDE